MNHRIVVRIEQRPVFRHFFVLFLPASPPHCLVFAYRHFAHFCSQLNALLYRWIIHNYFTHQIYLSLNMVVMRMCVRCASNKESNPLRFSSQIYFDTNALNFSKILWQRAIVMTKKKYPAKAMFLLQSKTKKNEQGLKKPQDKSYWTPWFFFLASFDVPCHLIAVIRTEFFFVCRFYLK